MRFVIVGNGVAGITAALALREKCPQAAITVVSGESDYFFSRTALMYAFMDKMTRRDLEPFERKVWAEKRIVLKRGWVVDLDARAHTLTLAGGEQIPYDRLLLATGSRAREAGWTGVTHFVSMQDLDRCEALARNAKAAVVIGGGLIGVELVECLAYHRVPVTFLVREETYWPAALSAEEGAMVASHIRAQGVDLQLGTTVESVQGGVVRTKDGREFAADLVGSAIGVEPNIEWLRGVTTVPALGRGVTVDVGFRTSLPDVFAAGDCAEMDGRVEPLWYAAKRHGEWAGRAMAGDTVQYAPPTYYNSAKFFHLEWTCAGETRGLSHYRKLAGEKSVRIIESDGIVIGFSMLGSRWNHRVLVRWIDEHRRADEIWPRLGEAQFDGEFMRAAL